jgi:hypothetical protein
MAGFLTGPAPLNSRARSANPERSLERVRLVRAWFGDLSNERPMSREKIADRTLKYCGSLNRNESQVFHWID